VKKFEDGGQDALKDGRGRKKAPEELTEADQQKLKMKQMEYEIERLMKVVGIQSVIRRKKRKYGNATPQ